MSSEPPPIYSQETPEVGGPSTVEPQLLIVPPANAANFQNGYLGAEGERATIEGEVQFKCAESFTWEKVTVTLRTVETACEGEIELNNSEVVLSSGSSSDRSVRSSFPFSIPLPPDTPQCLHTSRSSLAHTLTASVYRDELPPLSKSLIVHTRRYTSYPYATNIAPITRTLEDPTLVEVQVPSTTYKVGEAIPIYITVPIPRRELVLEQGLRIRNVRAEMVRLVRVRRDGVEDNDSDLGSDFDFEDLSDSDEASGDGAPSHSSLAQKRSNIPSSSTEGVDFRTSVGVRGEKKVIALSGASCRLNPSRPIQIRLVLHQPTESPLVSPSQELPTGEHHSPASDVDCASISQTSLIHSVSFRLRVHATFVNMSTRRERVSTVSIPIIVLPPVAPLPEVEHSMDAAYHKKHDRPPTRTVRADDDAPRYEEGEAGPSFLGGAPPPFEEREAPPPFFSAEAEASTSTRLPTFLESEREIFVPLHDDPSMDSHHLPFPELIFEGEGVFFGFPVSEQFDGYAIDLDRSYTPPPTLEMASHDTNVTGLANLDENIAMEALGLALDQHEHATGEHIPPPPPPPMDDPSDPPPSIDSDFRAPGDTHQTVPSHPRSPPPGLLLHKE
ncbi:hypothetical protein B0H21DRAFT_808352 [Amylocystis lapponica]|nr:hypothetical protein B0H21DRAFT_808352 [Amylocystis lapponica]